MQTMQSPDTLEVRKHIRAAIAELGATVRRTWTDPTRWSEYFPEKRTVTFSVVTGTARNDTEQRIAALANSTLSAAGFEPVVRVTNTGRTLPGGCGGSGPYIRATVDA